MELTSWLVPVGVASATTITAGFRWLNKYYAYKTELIKKEHANHSLIQDRREQEEKSRQTSMGLWLSKFEGDISHLRSDLTTTTKRLHRLEEIMVRVLKRLGGEVPPGFETEAVPLGKNSTFVRNKKG